MSNLKFNSNRLFVVRPSILLFRKTKERQMKNKTSKLNYVFEFLNRAEDTTIAIQRNGIYKDIVSDRVISSGIGSFLLEDEMCVNVLENDKVSLIKYMWERNVPDTKYNKEIEKYIFSLKPLYTMDEILKILKELKNEIEVKSEEESKVFTLNQKSNHPAYIRNVYTDMC